MKRYLSAFAGLAFACLMTVGPANAQIGGGGGPPPGGGGGGGGGGGSSSSSSSSQGHHGHGAGGAIYAAVCIGGSAVILIGGSVAINSSEHRQFTPAEAGSVVVSMCVPGIGSMLGAALRATDNPCTLRIAREAHVRWNNPRYDGELWMDGPRVAAEFNQQYYEAYKSCGPVHKKPSRKRHRNTHQAGDGYYVLRAKYKRMSRS